MSNLALQEIKQVSSMDQAITDIVLRGDLSRLSEVQRATYVKSLCDRQGLDYATQPFTFMTLQGKLVLYANRNASDQLRKVNGVSITDLTKEIVEGVLFITVKGRDKSGREDVATGAVPLDGLKGEARANAFLKCETKAKRRLTLSICGLGMLDETEVESIQIQNNEQTILPGPSNPVTEDGIWDPANHHITFGKKLAGMSAAKAVQLFSKEELASYFDWVENSYEKQGKPLPKGATKMIEAVTAVIVAMESAGNEKKRAAELRSWKGEQEDDAP